MHFVSTATLTKKKVLSSHQNAAQVFKEKESNVSEEENPLTAIWCSLFLRSEKYESMYSQKQFTGR